VLALVAMFRERWCDIQARTIATRTTLQEAEGLALKSLAALGQRGRAPPALIAAARVRQLIFTLLVRSYAQARNALRYLRRWQRDVDRIAPSLYSRRSRAAVSSTEPSFHPAVRAPPD
jgi:hypothetical protein